MLNLTFNPTFLSFFAVSLAAFALVLWWLVRKRKKSVWFPIIRVFDFEPRRLPKIKLANPPRYAFLFFALLALLMIILTFEPAMLISNNEQKTQTKLHILIDLSPSVSAHIGIEPLRNKVLQTIGELASDNIISVSTTASKEVLRTNDSTVIEEWLNRFEYQKAGVKIGSSLSLINDTLDDVDFVVILSDRDRYSWQGLNWTAGEQKQVVQRIDVTSIKSEPNIFVRRVTKISSPNQSIQQWDVELATSKSGAKIEGRILAKRKAQILSEESFQFGTSSENVIIRMNWKADSSRGKGRNLDDPMFFEIFPSSDEGLKLDNRFYVEDDDSYNKIALIAPSHGERVLEDPTFHLRSTLEVLGFDVRRFDQIDAKVMKGERNLVVVGSGSGIAEVCPHQVIGEQRAIIGESISRGTSQPSLRLWLAPSHESKGFVEICQCFLKLGLVSGVGSSVCKESSSSESWSKLLRSLGGVQIGGDLGTTSNSLAWSFEEQKSNIAVLVTTIPLRPNSSRGMSYGRLPLVIKSLMKLNLARGPHSIGDLEINGWPVVMNWADDILRHSFDHNLMTKYEQSNVPAAESYLRQIDVVNLPAELDLSSAASLKAWTNQNTSEHVTIVARYILWAVLFFLFCDFFVSFIMRLRKSKQGLNGLGVLAISIGLWCSNVGFSQIRVMQVGGYQGLTLSSSAMEVESRTSIELDRAPHIYKKIDAITLSDPWLWADQIQHVEDQQKTMRRDIQNWLRAGGFLIIQNHHDESALKKFTASIELHAEEAKWTAIPPDHELMRSFYLLDALPNCGASQWRGFQFDGRIAIIAMPISLLSVVADKAPVKACEKTIAKEQALRLFINIMMVSLATDYKKDQIHLPEILKRLR
jgi:hypothetical protein